MANEVSIYEPRKMGRVIRALPPVNTFFRSTFFKNEEIVAKSNFIQLSFSLLKGNECTRVSQSLIKMFKINSYFCSDKTFYHNKL